MTVGGGARLYELPIPSRKASLPSSERVLPKVCPKGILAKAGGAPAGVTQDPFRQQAGEGQKEGGDQARGTRNWKVTPERAAIFESRCFQCIGGGHLSGLSPRPSRPPISPIF